MVKVRNMTGFKSVFHEEKWQVNTFDPLKLILLCFAQSSLPNPSSPQCSSSPNQCSPNTKKNKKIANLT